MKNPTKNYTDKIINFIESAINLTKNDKEIRFCTLDYREIFVYAGIEKIAEALNLEIEIKPYTENTLEHCINYKGFRIFQLENINKAGVSDGS